jgi:hypothetical protein
MTGRHVGGIALQRCDDLLKVVGDLLVHGDHPGLAAGLGGHDELQGLPVLGACWAGTARW